MGDDIVEEVGEEGARIQPPFDLIVTSDSVYSPSLITPLLRTLHALSRPPHILPRRPPLVYICLERRDPIVVESFLKEAKEQWGFKCRQVEKSRIEKWVGQGWGWANEDWEGVEIWKLEQSQV
jgi:hypothetical protein